MAGAPATTAVAADAGVTPVTLVLFLASAAGADEPGSITAQLQSIRVQALQQEILSSPQLFEQALALQASPAFQRVLDDPELLARIESADFRSLLSDPTLAALTDDPIVKALAHDLER
jgi:hypothetical protein